MDLIGKMNDTIDIIYVFVDIRVGYILMGSINLSYVPYPPLPCAGTRATAYLPTGGLGFYSEVAVCQSFASQGSMPPDMIRLLWNLLIALSQFISV